MSDENTEPQNDQPQGDASNTASSGDPTPEQAAALQSAQQQAQAEQLSAIERFEQRVREMEAKFGKSFHDLWADAVEHHAAYAKAHGG